MTETYTMINIDPIPIECIEDEHESYLDYESSFWWNNRRYYLKDFTRVHENPWCMGHFPEYIHGVENEVYYNPIYISIIDDSYINVYEYKREDD